MKFFSLLFAALASAVCPWTIDQIKSIEVSPGPLKPGQNMTAKLSAYAQKRIEDGAYADVAVKLGLIKLLQRGFDLCDEARNAQTNVQCPINEGEFVIEQTVELPKEIPPAKFEVQIRGLHGRG